MVKEFEIAQMARMYFGIGMGLNLQFEEDGEDGGIEGAEGAWEAPRASLPKEESSFCRARDAHTILSLPLSSLLSLVAMLLKQLTTTSVHCVFHMIWCKSLGDMEQRACSPLYIEKYGHVLYFEDLLFEAPIRVNPSSQNTNHTIK